MNVAERRLIRLGERVVQRGINRYIINMTGVEVLTGFRDTGLIYAFYPHGSHLDERIVFEALRMLGLLEGQRLVIPGKKEYWFTNKEVHMRQVFRHPKAELKNVGYNLMIKYAPSMAFPNCEIVPISASNLQDIGKMVRMPCDGCVYSFLLAPEGTRNSLTHELHGGIELLSKRTGLPIVPVGLRGTANLLPKGAWLPRGLIGRKRLQTEVCFGQPIIPSDYNRRFEQMQALREAYANMGL